MRSSAVDLSCVLYDFVAKTRRSGCHCKFTTKLWKMLVVFVSVGAGQGTNHAGYFACPVIPWSLRNGKRTENP